MTWPETLQEWRKALHACVMTEFSRWRLWLKSSCLWQCFPDRRRCQFSSTASVKESFTFTLLIVLQLKPWFLFRGYSVTTESIMRATSWQPSGIKVGHAYKQSERSASFSTKAMLFLSKLLQWTVEILQILRVLLLLYYCCVTVVFPLAKQTCETLLLSFHSIYKNPLRCIACTERPCSNGIRNFKMLLSCWLHNLNLKHLHYRCSLTKTWSVCRPFSLQH